MGKIRKISNVIINHINMEVIYISLTILGLISQYFIIKFAIKSALQKNLEQQEEYLKLIAELQSILNKHLLNQK
ncbi:hypothetical protein CMT62_13320 [Elizabethkingia anophelis]|nr:hypothetical protein [Elizabethkingia anophelis]MDV3917970.1 hypothetical protein [Elizabethkingia anophelis]MDV3959315.1 hypothetical protein [Elizabethkingia anophelis]MDV3965420.1 hypothetical protein [Elizabethkingia anophelis]MDV3977904.1 hypothetical protein [Elizabethkingia anophelis]